MIAPPPSIANDESAISAATDRTIVRATALPTSFWRAAIGRYSASTSGMKNRCSFVSMTRLCAHGHGPFRMIAFSGA